MYMYMYMHAFTCTCTSYVHRIHFSSEDLAIENVGGLYYLELARLRVRWNEESTWLITIEAEVGSLNARGLCGNFDGDASSEWSTTS